MLTTFPSSDVLMITPCGLKLTPYNIDSALSGLPFCVFYRLGVVGGQTIGELISHYGKKHETIEQALMKLQSYTLALRDSFKVWRLSTHGQRLLLGRSPKNGESYPHSQNHLVDNSLQSPKNGEKTGELSTKTSSSFLEEEQEILYKDVLCITDSFALTFTRDELDAVGRRGSVYVLAAVYQVRRALVSFSSVSCSSSQFEDKFRSIFYKHIVSGRTVTKQYQDAAAVWLSMSLLNRAYWMACFTNKPLDVHGHCNFRPEFMLMDVAALQAVHSLVLVTDIDFPHPATVAIDQPLESDIVSAISLAWVHGVCVSDVCAVRNVDLPAVNGDL